jgi:hypothetical protein
MCLVRTEMFVCDRVWRQVPPLVHDPNVGHTLLLLRDRDEMSLRILIESVSVGSPTCFRTRKRIKAESFPRTRSCLRARCTRIASESHWRRVFISHIRCAKIPMNEEPTVPIQNTAPVIRRMASAHERKRPRLLSSHGTPLSNNPPPKTVLNHLTFCSAWAQLPVVTRFVLPKGPHLVA